MGAVPLLALQPADVESSQRVLHGWRMRGIVQVEDERPELPLRVRLKVCLEREVPLLAIPDRREPLQHR